MRIAQVAPLAESVPPKLYGGTERVVHWLAEELVEQGHKVTLFASGDSRTRASLVPIIPRALRLGRPRQDPSAACAALLADLMDRAGEFDIIHAHIDWVHLPILQHGRVPFLTTLHGRIDLPGLDKVLARFPGAPFVSISDDQRKPLPGLRWLGTVYHGLPREISSRGFNKALTSHFWDGWPPRRGPTLPSASPGALDSRCASQPSCRDRRAATSGSRSSRRSTTGSYAWPERSTMGARRNSLLMPALFSFRSIGRSRSGWS
jgi:hypothetical protein